MTFSVRLLVLLSLLMVNVRRATAEVRLARIFTDHMVLQRDQPIQVWGWADKDDRVRVEFAGQAAETTAAGNGAWSVTLKPLEASADGVVIATKGGVEKTAPDKVFPDGRPEIIRRRCEESLRLLRVERIELYQLHRPDPKVSFAESVGALAELRRDGKVRHVGLSNVTVAHIEEAQGIVPIASVQNRYNLVERADDPVVDYCAEHGIAYLPWGPLAAKPFAPEAPLARTASALAWLLRRAPNIIAIPGTTSITHLEENVAAARVPLSEEKFAAISANAPSM